MSTRGTQKQRKQEGEKTRKRIPAESSRKKTSGKVRGGQAWVPLPSNPKLLVPVGKAEKYPEEIGDVLSPRPKGAIVGGLIAENTLYAVIVSVESIQLSEHLPQHADSIYLHPETMKCCGIAIAQPVAVRNAAEGAIVVCKPWPVAKTGLDEIALGSTMLLGCRGNLGALVEVCKISKPSQLPVASELQLQPCSEVNFPLNDSFKNYILHTHDGHYICSGNYLTVQFYGEQRTFKAVRGSCSSDQHPPADISLQFSGSLLDSSILGGMSELSLNNTPFKHASRVAPDFSTPKDDGSVAVPEIDGSLEPDPGGSMCSLLEPEHDPVYLSSLTKYHSLTEDQSSSAAEGPVSPVCVPSEVLVYRITSRTKIQFVDAQSEMEKKDKVPLSSVGGLQGQTQLLRELVLYPLETSEAVRSKGLWFPHGVLLYGPAGVGKSLLAQAILSETSAHVISVSATDLMLGLHDSENRLQEVFREARENSPSLLVLDDLHDLCPHRDLSPSEGERRATATLATLMDQLNRTPPPAHMVVMATTNQIERVEPSLRRPGRFDREVEIPVPTATERKEFQIVMAASSSSASTVTTAELDSVQSDSDVSSSVEVKLLLSVLRCPKTAFVCKTGYNIENNKRYWQSSCEAQNTVSAKRRLQAWKLKSEGKSRTKANSVLACTASHVFYHSLAQHKALKRSLECGGGCEGVRVRGEDVGGALKEVRPSAMREVAVEVPKVLWSDIGGQAEIKQKLRESVEWPLKHPEAFARLGIAPPRGVLLYGPPGCSKTMIAQALATESGLNFIAVKGPELFSKWVGDSERAVRQVFGRARSAAPAIIFFDEIDALAVQRKSEGSTVADRVLAQLLTEMDGVEHLKEVLVVAATNRPDMIDKALLRPGRIDRMIYVPLPSENTRREILKLQFRRTPVAADVDIEALVAQTTGFSGAEVVSLCQEAALCAMHEDISAEQVALRHFQEALTAVKPQTDPATLQFFENYCKSGGTKGTS